MNAQTSDLKELLLKTDTEFHDLAAKHHELDNRLHELTSKHYLSEPEQIEEVNLKKRKLQLKDRMEHIMRERRRHYSAADVSGSPGPGIGGLANWRSDECARTRRSFVAGGSLIR